MGGCTGNPAAECKATPATPASEADAAAAPRIESSSMAVPDVIISRGCQDTHFKAK